MLRLTAVTLALTTVAVIPASAAPAKAVIVYFTPGENSDVDVVSSASVTKHKGQSVGMVRAVANMIQDNTGADVQAIRTSVRYPGNIDKLINYAADEQKRKVRPFLTSQPDFSGYDVIFIGYPIWWYDLPMVMYSFFDRYDFSGKRIIPFSVHNGSRFSSTVDTIKKLEPKAQVTTGGFTVSIQQVANADADVARWVRGLGLNR